MKSLTFLITLLFFVVAFGQKNSPDLNLTTDSDTLFWKSYLDDLVKDFNLPKLDLDRDFVFRKWSTGSVLEISKKNDSLEGKITYFVYEIWDGDYRADKFTQTYMLPVATTYRLFDFINSSRTKNIPSQKFIPDWKIGFDGVVHIYEQNEKSKYSFKKYWSPKIQSQLPEAQLIVKFNEGIADIANLMQYGKKFEEEIPFISYSYPGSSISVSKVVTKRERRRYKRERQNRLKDNKR